MTDDELRQIEERANAQLLIAGDRPRAAMLNHLQVLTVDITSLVAEVRRLRLAIRENGLLLCAACGLVMRPLPQWTGIKGGRCSNCGTPLP